MFKKAISLLLSLMLVVTTLSVTIVSVSAADSVYVVAGVPAKKIRSRKDEENKKHFK